MKIQINKPKRVQKVAPDPKPAPASESLVTMIHRESKKKRPARPHARVHASDLDPSREWCPREPAVLTMFGIKRPDDFLPTHLQFTFSMGYATADSVMRIIPRDRIWGNWKCRACGHVHLHRYAPDTCGHCGGSARALRYEEVLLQDPDTKQVGSADLIVDLAKDGRKTIVEIKSEGKAGWSERDAPTPDHAWRTRLYLRLASVTPWLRNRGVDFQSARILYACKDGHDPSPELKEAGVRDAHRSPFKEYVVRRCDEVLAAADEKLTEWLKFKEAYDTGASLPWPDGVCSSGTCSRARRCPARDHCFNVVGAASGPPRGTES